MLPDNTKLALPPVRITPPVPASTVEIVAVRFVTVIDGAPVPPVLSSVSTLATFPPLSKLQLLLLVVASAKISRPIVREESKLTGESFVILSVEKSANEPAPLAMVPPLHLVGSLHKPVPSPAKPVGFQVPLAAGAGRAMRQAAKPISAAAVKKSWPRSPHEKP